MSWSESTLRSICIYDKATSEYKKENNLSRAGQAYTMLSTLLGNNITVWATTDLSSANVLASMYKLLIIYFICMKLNRREAKPTDDLVSYK